MAVHLQYAESELKPQIRHLVTALGNSTAQRNYHSYAEFGKISVEMAESFICRKGE
jgi:hypothetical protein